MVARWCWTKTIKEGKRLMMQTMNWCNGVFVQENHALEKMEKEVYLYLVVHP
jgi:hypothetical protein